jgi:sorbitol/mannitol transport system substrate-binding protein
MLSSRASLAVAIGATVGVVALTGCSAGAGGGGGGGAGSNTVRVLMVNNPQMIDLQKLTAANFTKQTGINVEFKVLPENDVRDTIAQDVANQAGQYDVITISNFEVPFYAKNGWLVGLDGYADKDAAFDVNDILKPMRESLKGADGKLYAIPFYGESSMLMYRKDVFQ